MLVLTRKPNQSIIIGDDIEITVVEVKGDQVRLGINAPKHISVHRREVYEAIQKQRQAAAAAAEETVPPAQAEAPEAPAVEEEKPKVPARRTRRKKTDAAED